MATRKKKKKKERYLTDGGNVIVIDVSTSDMSHNLHQTLKWLTSSV